MAKKKSINANGYEYVDLGLPSGTLWATANIGAYKPNEPGLYFAWGDKKGYTAEQIEKDGLTFDWDDYKFAPENTNVIRYKATGEKMKLRDDAAHIHMKGDWHIPSPEQIQELIDNTYSKWTMLNGVGIKGRLFISKKDETKAIFIPAAGYAYCGAIQLVDVFGEIWASMTDLEKVDCAKGLSIEYDSEVSLGRNSRCLGFPIRGVIG